MNRIHTVEPLGLQEKTLELLVDGQKHVINLASASSRLAKAQPAQLAEFVVSPSGYGIHWPQLDEDLAIDPLIGIRHEEPVWTVAENAPEYKTKKEES